MRDLVVQTELELAEAAWEQAKRDGLDDCDVYDMAVMLDMLFLLAKTYRAKLDYMASAN